MPSANGELGLSRDGFWGARMVAVTPAAERRASQEGQGQGRPEGGLSRSRGDRPSADGELGLSREGCGGARMVAFTRET